jgi:hypothetical protein
MQSVPLPFTENYVQSKLSCSQTVLKMCGNIGMITLPFCRRCISGRDVVMQDNGCTGARDAHPVPFPIWPRKYCETCFRNAIDAPTELEVTYQT